MIDMFYLQEDFGDISLIDRSGIGRIILMKFMISFKKVLQALAKLQVKGDEGLGL